MLNRAHADPARDISYRLAAAETEEEVFVQVERAVSLAIGKLAENRQFKQDQTEDQRTIDLVMLLQMMGIPAVHDRKYGGHTDISIRLMLSFLWIAEAKNWRGCSWAYKGLRQLITRYAVGTPGSDKAAMLFYIQDADAAGRLKKWRESIVKQKGIPSAIVSHEGLSFISTHTHKGTGLPFTVKHSAVALYFKPEDA